MMMSSQNPQQEVGHDASQRLADDYLYEQVKRYRGWLVAQAERSRMMNEQQIARAYAENAGQVVVVGSQNVQSFAPFRYKYSALKVITIKQAILMVLAFVAWVLALIFLGWGVLVATLGVITVAYLLHLILDVALSLSIVRHSPEERVDEAVLAALKNAEWPGYTILCPLYKEARVVPQFVKAMQALDYPREKLQILFLTEEDDAETRNAILNLHLPPHFHVVTVPEGTPRTKPRACNYGLMEATGQYVVIFDAEDVPDPQQLKKAVLAFANHGPNLACVQAKLNFYNPDQNMLTRWFTAEYSLWFDLILPGLQQARFWLPLGGTSNHFPTHTIRALGGWDAFNVTEDCDLGLRLAWFHLDTIVLDSTTYEEANSRVKNWLRQRSRWIKGYMQTYLVHMREPWHYLREFRVREFLSLQLMIGGKTAVLFINPILWLLMIVALILHPILGARYPLVFPSWMQAISAICLVVGNFFYAYIYLLACMKRKHYGLVKYALLIPIYWLLMSVAACIALYQLIVKPHYWEKTEHGLHLIDEQTVADLGLQDQAQPQVVPAYQEVTSLPTWHQSRHRLDSAEFPSVVLALKSIRATNPAFSPAELARLYHAQHAAHKDRWFLVTLLTALGVSIASCIYTFIMHPTTTVPLQDLGAWDAWLPLTHILSLPFALIQGLWHTGIATSLPSIACYIVAAITVYISARCLTQNSLASFGGTLLLLLNPTLFSFATTPLSDWLCITMVTLTCACFVMWVRYGTLASLVGTAGSSLLASLTCYEGWALFLVLAVFMVGVGWLKHQQRVQIEGSLILFASLGGLGVILWMLWCGIVFGNPVIFMHASPLQTSVQMLPHDPLLALQFALNACITTLGPIFFALALLALLLFVVRRRLSPETIAATAFLVPFAFSLLYLQSGLSAWLAPGMTTVSELQMHYGIASIVPAALFLATLLSALPLLRNMFPGNRLVRGQTL